MTTAALKAIDRDGGVDNYLMHLDERSVRDSTYVTLIRNHIAAIKYHEGSLHPTVIRKLGYHVSPPPLTIPTKQIIKDKVSKELEGKEESHLL